MTDSSQKPTLTTDSNDVPGSENVQMMDSRHRTPGAALMAAIALTGLGSIMERPRRPSTPGAFGGSSRYPKKGRANPTGSKLARKAAEGKL